MSIKQYEIWIADLNPQIGTEPGKTRPVLIIQTNLLNKIPHASTVICPITTKVEVEADILRVHLKKGMANLNDDCDIMIDQIRAVDNKRLIKKLANSDFSKSSSFFVDCGQKLIVMRTNELIKEIEKMPIQKRIYLIEKTIPVFRYGTPY